jgi:hypothetical protein
MQQGSLYHTEIERDPLNAPPRAASALAAAPTKPASTLAAPASLFVEPSISPSILIARPTFQFEVGDKAHRFSALVRKQRP